MSTVNIANEHIHGKEVDFHDAWASSTRVEDVAMREAFEAPTAFENRFCLEQMRDLRGKKLLDIGAGLGETSVYFALKGAEVTTMDISPGMVDFALRLGKHHGVSLHGVVSAGERLSVPDASYDIVFSANTVHHVTDKEQFFSEMQRVLRPGGKFFTWDPLAYNPVINVYRKMATQVRTEDESPLTFDDLKTARKYFRKVQHREFWISSLTLFLKYYLIDRLHPNEDRYWKRILKESESTLWWWKPFAALDGILTRTPGVRRLAWNMVIWGEKG
jgi:2-polyprenyl-3-methyl-5-hydroxy-6-metoxy-1,4-benzoquinol methylase